MKTKSGFLINCLSFLKVKSSIFQDSFGAESLFLVTGEKLLMSGQRSKRSTKYDKRKVKVREMGHIKVTQCNSKVTYWLEMTLENS